MFKQASDGDNVIFSLMIMRDGSQAFKRSTAVHPHTVDIWWFILPIMRSCKLLKHWQVHMHIQVRVILLFYIKSSALYGMCYQYILVFLLEQTHLLTRDACALHRGRTFPSIMCFPPTPPRNRCTTPVPSRSWKVGMSQALTMSCFDDVVLCAFLYSWQMFCVDIMAPSLHMAKPPPGRLTPWRYRSVSFVIIFTILLLLFWTFLLCWRRSPSYSHL